MNDIPAKLEHLRNIHEWSKSQVAKHLGMSFSRYANYEYGVREPSLDVLHKIAKLYGVDLSYFTNGTDVDDVTYDSDSDLEKLIDGAHSYDGKPITGHDRDLIRAYLKGLYADK